MCKNWRVIMMKIVAFTGAGISKQSNIPTFMERPDVREKLFRNYANNHHEEYNEVIKQLKANMNGAEPNDAHIALAEYDIPIITMNIDGLHKQAGSDALELHGGLPEEDELSIAWSVVKVNIKKLNGVSQQRDCPGFTPDSLLIHIPEWYMRNRFGNKDSMFSVYIISFRFFVYFYYPNKKIPGQNN